MLTVDLDRLGLHSGDRLLDLGCGRGRHSYEALRRGARVVAVDLDAESLRESATMLAAILQEEPVTGSAGAARANALRLPFADGCFDRVIASEVFEHIHDDESAARELLRVLRPGGTLAVTVPRFWTELVCWALSTDYHETPGGHVRIYRESELVSRVERAGFVPAGHHYAHALHSPYWWLKCAVGVRDEGKLPVRLYHRFLVWDITHPNRLVRMAERALDPVLGKSLVVYFRKPLVTSRELVEVG